MPKFQWWWVVVGTITLGLVVAGYGVYHFWRVSKTLGNEKNAVVAELVGSKVAFLELKNQDQYIVNQELKKRIVATEKAYVEAMGVYELIIDRQAQRKSMGDAEKQFAMALNQLSKQEYEKVLETLNGIRTQLNALQNKEAQAGVVAVPPSAVTNEPPGSGYRVQLVKIDAGDFRVGIVAADYGSTRVIVDTASAGDCADNCPVLPLADYVARNGAYAGITGSYFCAVGYEKCVGKTNSFDLLVMNKDKVYFNWDNNVYSTNPGVIFGGGSVQFVGSVGGRSRDTGIDSMLSNFPLLVSGGNVVFGGDDDPKKGSKSNRPFVAGKGNMVYIGVVFNATVAETARVLQAMGMDGALNLDAGGSTALWHGGYKAGPGRGLPNAILFVKR